MSRTATAAKSEVDRGSKLPVVVEQFNMGHCLS